MSLPYKESTSPFDQQPIPKASVNIGPISGEIDENAKAIDQKNAWYVDYRIVNKFEKDHHRYMMGVTSPSGNINGTKVSFVQLASPTLLWICDWTAERWDKCPDFPDPESVDSDWILLDDHYEPDSIELGTDGVSTLYRISGTFVYGHRNPDPKTIRNVNFSRPPWIQDVFARTIPNDALTGNLSTVGGGNNRGARVVP